MHYKNSVQTTKNDALQPITVRSKNSVDLSFDRGKSSPRKPIYNIDLSGKSRIIETAGNILSTNNQSSVSPSSGNTTRRRMVNMIDQNSKRRVHENGLSMLSEHYAAIRHRENL